MHMLYNSDSFVVVHTLSETAPDSIVCETPNTPNSPQLLRHGFEIVDKRSGKEVYLDGSWAEIFQQQVQAWERQTPTQEEVERTLDSYVGLAQQPVRVH